MEPGLSYGGPGFFFWKVAHNPVGAQIAGPKPTFKMETAPRGALALKACAQAMQKGLREEALSEVQHGLAQTIGYLWSPGGEASLSSGSVASCTS